VSPFKDPRDKRVFVPKKTGGVALNFAHPVAWWIVITMTVIPALIVIGVTIAYLAG
jgi:uncharacterized membrane protein